MVTAPWNFLNKLEEYFTCVFLIKGFDEEEMKEYFSHFCENSSQSEKIHDFIKKNNISDFVSVPLYSFMLHQIENLITSESSVKNMNTCSRFLLQFLKSCLGSFLKDREGFQENVTAVEIKEAAIEKKMEDLIRLGEISYRNLLCGQLIVNTDDLKKHGLSEKFLTECCSCFFYKKHPQDNSFECRHVIIKEMFAALYCAYSVRDDELKECLDAWVRGIIPENAKCNLLSDVTIHHRLQLENFTRLFMGFLSTGNYSSLHSDSVTLKDTTREVLIQWFKDWLQEPLPPEDCLNFLHYIFELQDPVVTKRVSDWGVKEINLCKKPLNAIDIRALHFSLKESKLEKLALRVCKLEDKDVEQLRDIILNCKRIRVGSNELKSVGVAYLWEALESNQTLKTLRVYDNNINDEGTETLVQSLTKNTTLKELLLCVNNFTERGLQNIVELRKRRPDLKVVQKIVEDDDFLEKIENQVKELEEKWQQHDLEWLRKLLQKILNDLGEDKATSLKTEVVKRVQDLREKIQKLIASIDDDLQERSESSQIIEGITGKSMLLPCLFHYNRHRHLLKDLVITWQLSENQKVVHSFFDGKDHPEYQAEAFKGRTHLHHQELRQGNASILLKDLCLSDESNYTCYVTVHAGQMPVSQEIELQVIESTSLETCGRKCVICIIGSSLLLVIILIVGVIICKKYLKKKTQVGDERPSKKQDSKKM
nr:PREDICTED: uncharacterized protein LOC106704914 [Latimeria chalumnae]|eukprot:XP_014348506.1 PREDICTED: uncharacterized protein LOC106704914 [Latimeria chalumnae]